jgi:hypothetical protein
VAAAIAFAAWLVRLEAKGLQNEREIKRLWEQRKEDLEAAKEDRSRLYNTLTEIQSDIKTLIGKVGS